MIKRNQKRKRGASLVFSLFLMCFLTLISFSLVKLVNYESKNTLKQELSQQALYAAEAGVERKIAELKEEDTSDIALTNFVGSQYEVDVVSLGNDRYKIESTGYDPTKADVKEKRKISVVVYFSPATPEHALALGGQSEINSNITIYGTIKSNDRIIIGSNVTITESEPGKGDASIYTSYDGGVVPAIDIGGNFHVSVSGQYIKSRYNSGLAPDEHAPKSSDDTSQIYDEDNIWEKYNVTIVENDNSSDTDPVTIPSVDIGQLASNADYTVTPSNYTTIPELSDWTWDASDNVFELKSNETWDPNGKTFNFTEGIVIESNITVTGEGTVIVSSGSAKYGIELNSNIDGTYDGYARLNLIVSGGDWEEEDIRINSNIAIWGYIYGSSSSTINSNVNIKGILEVGDESEIKSNITITHDDDIPLDLPWTEGSAGEVQVVSWQEIKPD
ncbi:MAG: hypothetical protein J7L54_02305 [Elusimicrobia bacterium]|nr:hypothetical protein [Elusimicrobiota bacterium]